MLHVDRSKVRARETFTKEGRPSEKAGLIDCEVSHRLPKPEFFERGQSIKPSESSLFNGC